MCRAQFSEPPKICKEVNRRMRIHGMMRGTDFYLKKRRKEIWKKGGKDGRRGGKKERTFMKRV